MSHHASPKIELVLEVSLVRGAWGKKGHDMNRSMLGASLLEPSPPCQIGANYKAYLLLCLIL